MVRLYLMLGLELVLMDSPIEHMEKAKVSTELQELFKVDLTKG